MIPLKLMHTLESSAFSDFSGKKETLPRSNHILKIQWEINFFKRYFKDETLHNFFKNSYYTDLIIKLLSESILDLGKSPNQKTHESESADFLVGHFPRSKIDSESSF